MRAQLFAASRRLGALLCASAIAAAGFTTMATADTTDDANGGLPRSYVALGDSYVAGPGIPTQDGTGCARSNQNYPALVARDLRATEFVDASCSGAKTNHLSEPQLNSGGTQINAPQLDSLKPNTRLVTLGVGGNDIGFTRIVGTCVQLSGGDPTREDAPCRDHYTAGGTDQLAAAIAATGPKVEAILAEVKRRSPQARVLVVGYPTVLPAGDGCAQLPFAKGDMPYLRGVFTGLNDMLTASATANGVKYVDTAIYSQGHDACQPVGTKWVEGLAPESPAAPVHPNAAGMSAVHWMVIARLFFAVGV